MVAKVPYRDLLPLCVLMTRWQLGLQSSRLQDTVPRARLGDVAVARPLIITLPEDPGLRPLVC